MNILLATGSDVPLDALAPFEEFYLAAERRLTFFPQYYRFLLSMVMDLEDLGMAGSVGQQLAERAATWIWWVRNCRICSAPKRGV